MLLKSRLVSTLATVAALYALLAYGVQRALVWPSFQRLEEAQALADVQRVKEGFDAELRTLDQLCSDWAVWDDMYEFAEEPTAEFIAASLSDATLELDDLAAVFVARRDGTIVWRGAPGERTELRPGETSLLDLTVLPTGHPFLRCLASGRPVEGLMRTEWGTALVSSHAIVDSRGRRAPRGSLTFVRRMTTERLASVSRTAHVGFEVNGLDAYDLPAGWREARDLRLGLGQPIVQERNEEELAGVDVLFDLLGDPALLLRTRTPRDVTASGSLALQANFAFVLIGVVLLLATTYWLLHRIVVHPVNVLTRHVLEVGRSDDLTARVGLARRDEIGVLSREFDGMLEKLSRFRTQLTEAAHKAGMTEIATNVLHDVGNMLNSVRASAHLIQRGANELPTETVDLGVRFMEEQGDDLGRWLASDPRGKKLVPLLRTTADALGEQRRELVIECAALTRSVDRAAEVVRAQQSSARECDLAEPFDLAELLADAVDISKLGSDEFSVHQEIAAPGMYRGNRHKILRILVNLLNNSFDAVATLPREERAVALRARYDAPGTLVFEVADNGCGIALEDQERIFQHGFTTKSDGHGFGLHSCANAAREMKGSLCADSKGRGRGSVFTLKIPIARRQAA